MKEINKSCFIKGLIKKTHKKLQKILEKGTIYIYSTTFTNSMKESRYTLHANKKKKTDYDWQSKGYTASGSNVPNELIM